MAALRDQAGACGDDLERLLLRVEHGQLDTLEPNQVAALEAWLNADRQAAARIADRLPPPFFSEALPVIEPSEAAWQRVRCGVLLSQVAGTRVRGRRLWPAVFAAAAAIALAVGLSLVHQAGREADWHVQWARAVQIDELEVFEGAVPLVLSAGLDDTIPVIWVLDSGG